MSSKKVVAKEKKKEYAVEYTIQASGVVYVKAINKEAAEELVGTMSLDRLWEEADESIVSVDSVEEDEDEEEDK